MADRWGTRVYDKQKSLRGEASVRVTKSTVRVAFTDDPENIYEIPLDKAPAIVKPGKWFVSLSAKGDKMYSLYPKEGAFSLRFKEIAHVQGQPPARTAYKSHWKDNSGKDMETDYEAFTMIFEIVEGPCAGMQVAKFLRYYFVASQDGFVLFDKPRSPHTKTLSDTLDSLGVFDKGQMKFSENLLPAIQSRTLAANYPLMGILKDGNLESLTRVQNFEQPEEEELTDTDEEIGKKLEALEEKKTLTKEEVKKTVDELSPE
jgi:hypothetical protein